MKSIPVAPGISTLINSIFACIRALAIPFAQLEHKDLPLVMQDDTTAKGNIIHGQALPTGYIQHTLWLGWSQKMAGSSVCRKPTPPNQLAGAAVSIAAQTKHQTRLQHHAVTSMTNLQLSINSPAMAICIILYILIRIHISNLVSTCL